MIRARIDPTPTADEAAAILAALEAELARQPQATPKVSRWRLAARTYVRFDKKTRRR